MGVYFVGIMSLAVSVMTLINQSSRHSLPGLIRCPAFIVRGSILNCLQILTSVIDPAYGKSDFLGSSVGFFWIGRGTSSCTEESSTVGLVVEALFPEDDADSDDDMAASR